MSRSKRAPIWTEGYGGSWRKIAKKQANKRIRKATVVGNNMNYKKEYSSWTICDYKFYDKKGKWKVRSK